jgi:putative phosphoribosyl transferase
LEVNNILQGGYFKTELTLSSTLPEGEWIKRQEEVQKEENKKDEYNKSVIILAVPDGGVVIGDIIAPELGLKLDVIVSRKIGAPFNPELAIGAVISRIAIFK